MASGRKTSARKAARRAPRSRQAAAPSAAATADIVESGGMAIEATDTETSEPIQAELLPSDVDDQM
jgi:hypothetical protein